MPRKRRLAKLRQAPTHADRMYAIFFPYNWFRSKLTEAEARELWRSMQEELIADYLRQRSNLLTRPRLFWLEMDMDPPDHAEQKAWLLAHPRYLTTEEHTALEREKGMLNGHASLSR